MEDCELNIKGLTYYVADVKLTRLHTHYTHM